MGLVCIHIRTTILVCARLTDWLTYHSCVRACVAFPFLAVSSPVSAVDTEKARGDRFEHMLEDSRRERDAECERLQKNIDSLQEQLDVS